MAANSAIHYLFAKNLHFNNSKPELRNVPLRLDKLKGDWGTKNAFS